MPLLYSINHKKVFQRPARLMSNQSHLLDDVMIEANWIDYLADELKRYDGSVSWHHRINYHLNSSQVQSKVDTFKVIYARLKGRLDNKFSPITASEAQGIVQYLSEGVHRCTQGILERAQMFVASMQLPESIDEFLCVVRTEMIEDMFYSGIKSQNVHDKAIILKWANEAGYAINTTISGKVPNTSIDDLKSTILAQFEKLMERHYQYPDWPDLIIKQLQEKNLVYAGYIGYQEAGYTREEFDKFLKAISKLLGETVGYDCLVTDEFLKINDINWDFVRQKLWHKLVNEAYVINPEPRYGLLATNSDEKTKALYYFIALAKYDPENLFNYYTQLVCRNHLSSIMEQGIKYFITHDLGYLKRVLTTLHGIENYLSQYDAHINNLSVECLTRLVSTKLKKSEIDDAHLACLLDVFKQFKGEDELKDWLKAHDWSQLRACLAINSEATYHFLSDNLAAVFNREALLAIINREIVPNGDSIWHLAVKYFSYEFWEQLIHSNEQLPSITVQDSNGDTALHLAVRLGHEQAFNKMLACFHDQAYLLGIKNYKGQTVFHTIARFGYRSFLKSNIEYNIDLLSAQDQYRYTPLQYAAKQGYKHIAEFLLSQSVNTTYARSALETAVQADQAEIAMTIVDYIKNLTQLNSSISLECMRTSKLKKWLVVNNKVDLLAIMSNSNRWRHRVEWDYCDGVPLLHKAAELGHTEVLNQLITLGANINLMDARHGGTPLHQAASRGHTNIVKILLGKTGIKADIVRPSDEGSPLHVACAAGHAEIVDMLCRHNPQILRQQTDRATLYINTAAQHGHLPVIQTLLSYNPRLGEPGAQNKFMNIAHYAAVGGFKDVVQFISEKYEPLLHKKSKNLFTTLMFTVMCPPDDLVFANINDHKKAIISLLVDRIGLDINAQNHWGDTVMHLAIRNKQSAIVQYLIEHYGHALELDKQNKQGQSLLHTAFDNDCPEIAKTLVDYGASLNDIDRLASQYDASANVLHYLARYGYHDLTNSVIVQRQLGPDVINQPNSQGQTPLMVAAQFNQSLVFDHLKDRQADLTHADHYNNTCLHYILQNGDFATFDRLLDEIDQDTLCELVQQANSNNLTLLHLAYHQGNTSIYRTLYNEGFIPDLARQLYEVAMSMSQVGQPLAVWLMDNDCCDIVQTWLAHVNQNQIDDLVNQQLMGTTHHQKVYHKILNQGSYELCRMLIQTQWFSQLSHYLINHPKQHRLFVNCFIVERYDQAAQNILKLLLSLELEDGLNVFGSPRVYLFHYAVQNLHQSSVLIDVIAEYYPGYINQRDLKGNTALHHAVMFKNADAVDALLRHKIDTAIINNQGQTAATIAHSVDVIQSINQETIPAPLAFDECEPKFVPKIEAKMRHPVPIDNINWRTGHIEQNRQITASSQGKLHDSVIDYEKITTQDAQQQLARAYFTQLACHEPTQLSQYVAKLQQFDVLNITAKHALMHIINHDPSVLGPFLHNLLDLQQRESLECLSGLLDEQEGKQLLNSVANNQEIDINLPTMMILINTSQPSCLLSKPDHDDGKTPLDIAVMRNNQKLVDQILAYDGVHIDLHRQLDNIENSPYESVDIATIMDKLCAYGGWQDKQYNGNDYILSRILRKDKPYFKAGLAIIRYSQALNVDHKFLSTELWAKFIAYAASLGELTLFQLIANDHKIINATNWNKYYRIGHAAASCTHPNAAHIIDLLTTISQQRTGAFMRMSLLRVEDQQSLIPLHKIASNVDQGYNLLDKLIEKRIAIELGFAVNGQYHSLECAVFEGNVGFLERLIDWRNEDNALKNLDKYLRNALFMACRYGRLNIVELYERKNLQHFIAQPGPKSDRTALHFASCSVKRDRREVVPAKVYNDKRRILHKLINDYTLEPDKKDKWGLRPVDYAISNGAEPIVLLSELINFSDYFSPDKIHSQITMYGHKHRCCASDHPFFIASKVTDWGDYAVNMWLNWYPDEVNIIDRTCSQSAICVAAMYNNQQAVKRFLELDNIRCNKPVKGQYNYLLHWLVENKDIDNFVKVLDRSTREQVVSQLCYRNALSLTPLQLAVQKDHIDIIDVIFQYNQLLFDERLNLFHQLYHATPPEGESFLIWLLDHERDSFAESIINNLTIQQACDMLLQKNTNSSQYTLSDILKHDQSSLLSNLSVDLMEQLNNKLIEQSQQYETLGHLLAMNPHPNSVVLLQSLIKQYEQCHYNCNLLSQVNSERQTVLHAAAANHEQGRDMVAMLAQKYPGDINQMNNSEQTPMHVAAEQGNWRVVQVLKSLSQTSLDLQDRNGRTPKQVALNHGHLAVVDTLTQSTHRNRLTDNVICHSVVNHNAAMNDYETPSLYQSRPE